MRLLFIIDHFGSGGAQRQMVSLALGLVAKGHEVEFFIYYPERNFFRPELEQAGVQIHEYPKQSKGFSLKVLFTIRKLILVNQYDVAIAFLETPSIYLLIAGLGKMTRLIVSDRSSYLRFDRFAYTIKKQLFHLADIIVANSYTQSDWLTRNAMLPERKVKTIYNGYNLNDYPFCPILPSNSKELRLIGIGRINPVKNIQTLIEGLYVYYSKHGWCPSVTWVGRSDSPEYEKNVRDLLDARSQVKKKWVWAGQRNDIPRLFAEHNALILPSSHEGLPNVVCEAMLAGKPVLASNVCDNPNLVFDGERGFLFDPKYPDSIAEAIEKLISLKDSDWIRVSQNAHNYAKMNLGLQRFIRGYEDIITRLHKKANKRPV